MKIVLHGKNKLGFVLGTCRKHMFDPILHELWDKYNAIVLAWIMNIVAPNLLSSVIYVSDAHKIWEDLRERFDKVNASRSFYLHKEIGKLTQGLFLNDTFDNIKDQILMTRPVPNINQAYAMIINVESQRRNNATVGVSDPTALLSNRAPTDGHNHGYKPRNNLGKSSLQCDFCYLKGNATNVVPTYGSATDSSPAITGVSSAPFFTQDQYNQILQMLNKGKQVDTMANSATMNTTGTITTLMSHLVIISHTGDLSLFKDKSVHHELFTRNVMGIGKEEHGRYILKHKEQDVPEQLPDSRPFHSSSFVNTTSSEFQTNNASIENKNTSECPDETVLWHKRLGYAPLRVLKRIESLTNVQLKDHFCTVCPVAKQTKIPFSSSNKCFINAFDLIHVVV
ncbi:uncharacterized protein [Nicotiana sylvestris]|uniref:uncharacterized protein n=1 Tax=Nicotiana sylvestris TaxID=4096 RepID=UPI00388C691B